LRHGGAAPNLRNRARLVFKPPLSPIPPRHHPCILRYPALLRGTVSWEHGYERNQAPRACCDEPERLLALRTL
jgi:hypothetical protein